MAIRPGDLSGEDEYDPREDGYDPFENEPEPADYRDLEPDNRP